MSKRTEVVLADLLQKKGYIRGPFGSALKRAEMKSEGIPVYEQQHAIYNSREFRFFIDDNKFEELKRFQVETDDLVISCSGTVGKVTIIRDDDPKGIISQALLILRADSKKVMPQYLKYFFTSQIGYNAIVSRSSGSVQVNISKREVIEQIPLSLPSIPEQKKIVSLLKNIDDKIETNEAINRNLSEQTETLFQSWFVDFNPWSGEMPENWKQGDLGDFVTIKRGGSPRPIQDYLSDEGLRWLKISDVTGLQSPFVSQIAEHIKESGLKKTVFLKQGALVLSNSATPGIPKILDVDSCIHDGWLYFPESQLSNEFLYLFFKNIRPKLVALGNGSVFTNLKTDILKGYSFAKPDGDTLQKFDDLVIPMFDEMRRIARENNKLAELRDSLLPKLMSGELNVSDLDI